MKKYISAGFIMILGSNVINASNYLYHLIMGRLLPPLNYGELQAILSLLGLFGTVSSFFGIVVIKFISAQESKEEISKLTSFLGKKIYILSRIFFITVIIFSPLIAYFLNVNISLIILSGFIFLFFLPSYFYRSVLQGMLHFKESIISQISETFLKLIIGVGFVLFGYKVTGAIGGLLIAIIVGWLLSRFFIYKLVQKVSLSDYRVPGKLFKYSLPVFIQSLAMTSLYSSDLILVKHYFSGLEAGLYASVSTLGRIIFFAAGPVSAVMFPIVSKRHAKGENFKIVFAYSFLLTLAVAVLISGVYFIFPEVMVQMLFGSQYLASSFLLGLVAVFMTLYTISYLLVNFFLSIGKTNAVFFPAVASIIQILGIILYHNSLKDVVFISIGVSVILVLSLCIYYLLANENP